MRSFPNVQAYLSRTDGLHFLADRSLDFSVKQPFSSPKQRKTPVSRATAQKRPQTPKVKTQATPKVSVKLKRKWPADGGEGSSSRLAGQPSSLPAESSWEVVKAKNVKGRKKVAAPSKRDSPQLKLSFLMNVKTKSPQVAQESKLKSGFKSFLHHGFAARRAEKSDEAGGGGEEIKDSEEEKKAASDSLCLAEEPEDPYMFEDEEATPVTAGKIEEYGPAPSPSGASSGYRLESDTESDSSFSHSRDSFVQKTPLSSVSQNAKTSDSLSSEARFQPSHSQPQSRKAQVKRSLSPSDSDGSIRKRAKTSRDPVVEEDSRSMGMCSDASTASREEDENQNMANKVQKMHLSDSSSTKDIKDSASTSSNGSSLACHTPPPPPPTLWSRGSKTAGAKRSLAGQPSKVLSTQSSQCSSGKSTSASSKQVDSK